MALCGQVLDLMARSERFELPTLGIEIRCSIQLSYERVSGGYQSWPGSATAPFCLSRILVARFARVAPSL
jgi:hypothetical protein